MREFFAPILSEVYKILRYVAAAAVAIGLFFGGVAYQQSVTESEILEAENRGYQRGTSEASLVNSSNKTQTEAISQLFSQLIIYIENGRQKEDLSQEASDDLESAIEAAQAGDFDLAVRSLNSSATRVDIGSCISTGQAIAINENMTIDHCESGGEIAFVGFQDPISGLAIGVRLNGRFDYIAIGERSRISNEFDCYVTFLRVEESENRKLPIIRVTCQE